VNIFEAAHIITEKTLRFVSPGSPLTEPSLGLAILSDIVRPEFTEGFVKQLGSEALMMGLVLDTPTLTRFLYISQNQMPVSTFVDRLVDFLHSPHIVSAAPETVDFGSGFGDSEASDASQEQPSVAAQPMPEEEELARLEQQETQQEAQAEIMRQAEEQARQEQEQFRQMQEASAQEHHSANAERNKKVD
jgi:hypothetical protein